MVLELVLDDQVAHSEMSGEFSDCPEVDCVAAQLWQHFLQAVGRGKEFGGKRSFCFLERH